MTHWTVGGDWRGKTAVVVAGGPSVTLSQVRAIGMARARGAIKVIAINDAMYPCWFADVGYACDPPFWRHHRGMPDFPGRRVSLDDCGIAGVDFLTNTGTEGFDPDPGNLRTGGNSGYQAMHLCAHLHVDRILMVGFDMRGASHWFGDHPPGVKQARPPNMANRIRCFDGLKEPLADRGIEVVNCSPGSALGTWKHGSLESELSRLK